MSGAATVSLHEGDATWHDGPGWYYTVDEYPDEGSCGAFPSRILAEQHAAMQGYTATIRPPTPDKAAHGELVPPPAHEATLKATHGELGGEG